MAKRRLTVTDSPYRQANAAALGKIKRFLAGDFDHILDAHNVVGNVPPEAKEETMAKKVAGEKQLALNEDWLDKVPAEVQSMADDYVDKLRRKSAAVEKYNAAKTTLIDKMKETKCEKVKVAYKDGEKIIELREIEKLLIRKPESAVVVGDDEEGDDE